MRRWRRVARIALGAIWLAAAPAAADHDKGDGDVEIFAGGYFPEADVDADTYVGLRGGYNVAGKMALEGTVGGFDRTDDAPVPEEFEELAVEHPTPTIDLEQRTYEASFLYAITPKKRGVLYAFGGVGWLQVDTTLSDLPDPEGALSEQEREVLEQTAASVQSFFESLQGDSGTFHVGFGAKAHADRLYVRPELRVRWLEDCEDDCVHWEATLALGIKFPKL